ncbi:uncharacterized protein TNCV_335801 [Trichonephila clavipes]|nr:uncharacterized protein TNCV_335801 [Trichonephila clavipes]
MCICWTFFRRLQSCAEMRHSSDSKQCPKWKAEKEIQAIKTNRNISYLEARKLIAPQLSQTYAQVAKPSTVTSTTQTDENITQIKSPPLQLLQPLLSVPQPDKATFLSRAWLKACLLFSNGMVTSMIYIALPTCATKSGRRRLGPTTWFSDRIVPLNATVLRILACTALCRTQGLRWSLLVGVEGNQTKPCFVDEAPVGEPGVFPVGDEMGAGWDQDHTVHRLSLRGGGQQLRGLHILEVLVERAKHSSPVRAGEEFISKRD